MFMLLFISGQLAFAQSWMQGYNFRKKITIDKSRVRGTSNLLDFPVLIEIEDMDLRFMQGCERTIQHSKGLDISFTGIEKPFVPISFQLDSYDAVKGKLTCWVRIRELIANGNPGLNQIYLYYGTNAIHRPFSSAGQATWSGDYQKVWHMNNDAEPSTCYAANRSPGNDATGNPGMNKANFRAGRIGSGVLFNGFTDVMSAPADTNTTICITAWVKFNQIGKEQVILANDSTTGGYKIKINAAGNVVFETFSSRASHSIRVPDVLVVNTWYYLTFIENNGLKRVFINGIYSGGGGSDFFKIGRGAKLSIGASKQNDRYFNGTIDELRIQHTERSIDWLATEYRNQENPAAFISVSARELNPAPTEIANTFTGGNGTEEWADAGNWSYGEPPEDHTSVVIKAGKRLKLGAGRNMKVNRLVLEPGAVLFAAGNLEVNCTANFGMSSFVILSDNARLTFKNDVINNGSIIANESNGTLVFNGDRLLQTFSGAGSSSISRLEINTASPVNTVVLQTKVDVSKQLELIRGTLNANGKLTLCSGSSSHTASLLPIQNTSNANIIGQVNVQRFIDGDFPAPSTARGWWLLASPVYHSIGTGLKQYQLTRIKESVFVTGSGGIKNGFDASPHNKPTIYTHDQALPGTLLQKYTGIPDMNTQIPLGKGFYVFLRGSRAIENAYLRQLQGPPFFNPGPYMLTFSGKLFTGELSVELYNRNTGTQGDGFNLLGNPYASALTWGKLQKLNLAPFIWVFDPKHNAYQVTDDPAYVIKSGTGFFVKVSNGFYTGSLTFREDAKYTGDIASSSQRSSVSGTSNRQEKYKSSLKITLERDGFSDEYVLRLDPAGNDGITDADAPKIGEGYLSISGLTINGNKLSVDERATGNAKKEIWLYVKGWASGKYSLNLKGIFTSREQFTLIDHYLDKRHRVMEGNSVYNFFMNTDIAQTYGMQRFSLLYEPLKPSNFENDVPVKDILFYPNPVNDVIFLKSGKVTWKNLKILISTISGHVVWSNYIPVLEAGIPFQLPCNHLMKGIYVLQVVDIHKNKTISSFKVLKN